METILRHVVSTLASTLVLLHAYLLFMGAAATVVLGIWLYAGAPPL